jgi:hypothetical protein
MRHPAILDATGRRGLAVRQNLGALSTEASIFFAHKIDGSFKLLSINNANPITVLKFADGPPASFWADMADTGSR